MYQAYNQLTVTNSTTRANVIVLMTDGRPNGFTGLYYQNGVVDLRKNPGSCDTAHGILKGEVEQWAGGPLVSGTTAGLSIETATTVNGNDGAATANSTGCAMASNISGAPPTDLTADAYYGSSRLFRGRQLQRKQSERTLRSCMQFERELSETDRSLLCECGR